MTLRDPSPPAAGEASGVAGRLRAALRLPVICSPMFLVSNPETVIAQCSSGLVGACPALNARPQPELDVWLRRIADGLEAYRQRYPDARVGPHAVNLVVKMGNERLQADLASCARYEVPLVISSLGAPTDIVRVVHGYGGLVFHDVTSVRHARRALEAGVDGLILVCAGAGGHAGALSPFALLSEVRAFYDGPLVLAGAITDGASIFAAEVMGADLVYMGTRFIATQESSAVPAYKRMLVDSAAADIVYTPHFSGIPANYLKPSIAAAGLDPDRLPAVDAAAVRAAGDRHKRWKDIWGAGQGVGGIDDILPTAALVDRLAAEYDAARVRWRTRLCADDGAGSSSNHRTAST
ncbi:MAG: 2-nitropropane dioxygenase [Bordetella sp. SCN 67-23]|nr:nitronate monooxygenase [Burkholderiales bacterium]ODS73193.1 MAG: 2-nitropropane dioxygenase [Bordetella sp. SCN 67-23]ODU72341.1 MAG: 2-nitropropane dioxygenase [Bordetella sp. SCN 68-11]OJW95142.1 MAG: 2-nitropropane dioxygenase [Burkholderiales bacterium 67-32]